MSPVFKFTDEMKADLRHYWRQQPPMSIQDIADSMGLTFGQVRGMRRRLELPARRTDSKPLDRPPPEVIPRMRNRDDEHVTNCLEYGGFGVLNTSLFIPGPRANDHRSDGSLPIRTAARS
jgi:hypothetical protein